MKECKKWWDNDSMEGDWDYEHYAAIGWDRALEWVLSTGYIDDYGDEILDFRQIRKELEE